MPANLVYQALQAKGSLESRLPETMPTIWYLVAVGLAATALSLWTRPGPERERLSRGFALIGALAAAAAASLPAINSVTLAMLELAAAVAGAAFVYGLARLGTTVATRLGV